MRVVLADADPGGTGLRAYAGLGPAASVRLLLPGADGELDQPRWNGNVWLLGDGRRAPIRTMTPLPGHAPDELAVDVVLHEGGAASAWAEAARPGAPAAVSGPGRAYEVLPAPAYLLAGDETAIPAISQLVAAIAPGTLVDVHVAVTSRDAEVDLGARPGVTVSWHDSGGGPSGEALVDAVAAATIADGTIADGTRVWVAGEAAAVQRVRRLLFDDRGIERSRATVRGYWKAGRAGDDDAA